MEKEREEEKQKGGDKVAERTRQKEIEEEKMKLGKRNKKWEIERKRYDGRQRERNRK